MIEKNIHDYRPMDENMAKVLYSEEDLQEAAKRLGAQLTKDYVGKRPIFVCILKGSIHFMSDLIRNTDAYMEIGFMDVASYGDGFASSGEVKIVQDLDISVENRDIVIVEDIIDTGRTMKALVDLLKERKAASVKICTLLNKAERREADVEADYIGFEVPNEFVVGYGLDYLNFYRNLPYIGVVKPEVYK